MRFTISLATLMLAAVCAAWPQSATPIAFEVASVKPAAPCCNPGQWPANRPAADRINFRYVTLWYCITYAYGMKSYQVSGPGWLKSDRYDIVAKGPEGTRREDLPKMMQALLADRFKLRVRRETREISGLALVVDKDGPKLKEAAPESGDGHGGAQIGMSMSPDGVQRMEMKGGAISSLINTLSALVGLPIVDRTGLPGRYDCVLEFSRADSSGWGGSGGYNEPPSMPPPPPNAEPGLSIYSSIRKLGLRLDGQKFPMDAIVIEACERTPSEN
jgi:uncharacterized protein (TIGR03435 family)